MISSEEGQQESVNDVGAAAYMSASMTEGGQGWVEQGRLACHGQGEEGEHSTSEHQRQAKGA